MASTECRVSISCRRQFLCTVRYPPCGFRSTPARSDWGGEGTRDLFLPTCSGFGHTGSDPLSFFTRPGRCWNAVSRSGNIFLEHVDAGLQLFVEDEVLQSFTCTCAKRRDFQIRWASGRPRTSWPSSFISALQDLGWSGFADQGREGVELAIILQELPSNPLSTVGAVSHAATVGSCQQSCKARQHRRGVRWRDEEKLHSQGSRDFLCFSAFSLRLAPEAWGLCSEPLLRGDPDLCRLGA